MAAVSYQEIKAQLRELYVHDERPWLVGFSGGNKYLFPGVAGPQILNFFHWLGAVVTNPMIIGNKWTPVRRVVDRAAAMVKMDKLCFSMVVGPQNRLAGLFAGTPEAAWDAASDLSRKTHQHPEPSGPRSQRTARLARLRQKIRR